MNTITVKIDIETPTGRRLLREIERHPKVAKVEHEIPAEISGQKTFSHEEIWSKMEKKLNNHYGSNLKLKY
jgi:hypothetical protein